MSNYVQICICGRRATKKLGQCRCHDSCSHGWNYVCGDYPNCSYPTYSNYPNSTENITFDYSEYLQSSIKPVCGTRCEINTRANIRYPASINGTAKINDQIPTPY